MASNNRYLSLAQTFGAPADQVIKSPLATVVVHDQDVPLGSNGAEGFWVNWELGGDGLTLIGFDPELTMDEFVAMANSVGIPEP